MFRTDKTNNAEYSLCYHFITVVKYKQKVFLNETIISDLKVVIDNIAYGFDVEIIEQECGEDYLHILFRTKPTIDLCKFINSLKGRSSKIIREIHKDFLKDKLWGDSFWSPSYFLATAGNVTIDILKTYIDNQKTLEVKEVKEVKEVNNIDISKLGESMFKRVETNQIEEEVNNEDDEKIKAAMEETIEALKTPEVKDQISEYYKAANSIENKEKELDEDFSNGEIVKDQYDSAKKIIEKTKTFQANEKRIRFGKIV